MTEVPWDNTTQTPQHNPLEKLPVLFDTEDLDNAVYESHFILDWIEYKYPPPEYLGLIPETKENELFAKKVQGKPLLLLTDHKESNAANTIKVIADGICDACVLMFFEKQRSSPSQEWTSRQRRKVDGGLNQLAAWVGDREFLVNDKFTLADIAAGAVLGYLRVRFQDHPWQQDYPNLKRYSDSLEARESFKTTVPTPQTIKDRIV